MTTLSQEYKELRCLNSKRLEIIEEKLIQLNTLMNTKCLPRVNDTDFQMRSLDSELNKQIVDL